MKITKYPQSNFLIESSGKKILIDPGNLTFANYSVDDFGSLDAVLITHQHPDHLDKEAVRKLIEKGVPMYGNRDVASQFEKEPFDITKVFHENEFEVAGFKIKPVDLPHFQGLWCEACNQKITPDTINEDKRCKLHPDQEPKKVDGPPNTGYIINDTFFHPGDGIHIEGYSVKNAAIPIGGPTVDYDMAWKLVKALNAQLVVPIHYSIAIFGADPKEFSERNPLGVKVAILEDGGDLEIS